MRTWTGLVWATGIVAMMGVFATSTATPTQGATGVDSNGAAVPAGDVYLEPGDDLQQAVKDNPEGTVFVLRGGVYPQARLNPRSGQSFWGEEGAVLDGENAKDAAFNSSASNVEIHNLRIERYRDNGIRFSGGSGVWVDNVVVYDTGSGDGEGNGAVRFDDSADIRVTGCYFEQVSSGVLPTSCTGPIVIEHNAGLNIGRNMVQLAACSGGGQCAVVPQIIVRSLGDQPPCEIHRFLRIHQIIAIDAQLLQDLLHIRRLCPIGRIHAPEESRQIWKFRRAQKFLWRCFPPGLLSKSCHVSRTRLYQRRAGPVQEKLMHQHTHSRHRLRPRSLVGHIGSPAVLTHLAALEECLHLGKAVFIDLDSGLNGGLQRQNLPARY